MKKLLSPTNFLDSWQLAKESFVFLSEHKDLNLIPLIALVFLLGSVFILFTLLGDKVSISSFRFYGFIASAYFLLSILAVYLNTALTAIVLKRLNEEPASISYGLYVAGKRLGSILKWAFMLSTVGVFAKIIEGPQNLVEKILGYSVGFYWSIGAYFVIPILVSENTHPIKAMQRSVDAVGHGWKNTVSVKALITIFFVFILLIISEFTGQPNETYNLIVWSTPVFLIVYILGAMLESIIVSALYINMVQQKDPKYFDTSVLGRAFVKERD